METSKGWTGGHREQDEERWWRGVTSSSRGLMGEKRDSGEKRPQ